MSTTVFGFRPGRSIRGVNPQAAGEELSRLRRQHGTLTAEAVLEAAADPASPLHAGFEWDDSAAAHQHRLAQARRLIVSVRVLNPPTAQPLTAFVSVRTPEHGRAYLPTVEALSDDDLRARVLTEIRTMIEGLERRYAHFAGAADLLARLKTAAA